MRGLVQSVTGFVKSLHLEEKLSPRKNNEIIWFYIFLPCFFLYLIFLSQYLNEKPPIGKIEVYDDRFTKFVNPLEKIEIIASGLNWTEGPLWLQHNDLSHLVFSDTLLNRIYKWEEGKGMFTIGKTIYLDNSGCRGVDSNCTDLHEAGSNGLLRRNDDSFDLIAAVHGDRGIALLRENGTRSMIATHYKTQRLNSPNDLIWSPEGHLYFTDPTYGLQRINGSRVEQELPHSGVYMIKADFLRLALESGEPTAYVRLVTSKLPSPNGLAFSPDFAKLYVSNSDEINTFIQVYEVTDNGALRNSKLFFNGTEWWNRQCAAAESQQCDEPLGPFDGIKIDIFGNIFAAGFGSVLVISPEGDVLGRLRLDRPVSNIAFGGDGRLYITAKDIVARLWVKTKPVRIVGVGSM